MDVILYSLIKFGVAQIKKGKLSKFNVFIYSQNISHIYRNEFKRDFNTQYLIMRVDALLLDPL